jgi:hypothetical protein
MAPPGSAHRSLSVLCTSEVLADGVPAKVISERRGGEGEQDG